MNDALPPPPPPAPKPQASLGMAILGATIVLLAALGAASYVMWQELRAVRDAEPVAPPAVTQALGDLRNELSKQRGEYADQLSRLQEEIAALKSKEEETPVTSIDEQLAPLQAQLDAINSKLTQLQTAPATVPTATEATATPAAEEPAPVGIPPALREAIESGEPYENALAAVKDQLPTPTYETLAEHAAEGVPSTQELHQQLALLLDSHPAAAAITDQPINDDSWAGRANRWFGGLVKIKRVQEHADVAPGDPYADLRNHADQSIDDLIDTVQDLPADAREPFAHWLDAALAHRDVDHALNGN